METEEELPVRTTYFVVKSYNKQGLEKSRRNEEWACSDRQLYPQPRHLLGEAFKQGRVYLLFSVNNCHGWHGYAIMTSLPAETPCQLEEHTGDEAKHVKELDDKLWYKFKVRWEKLLLEQHPEKCLPLDATKDLFCADQTTPLNQARNFQEVNSSTGQKLCQMIDNKYEELMNLNLKKKEDLEAKKPAPFFKMAGTMGESHAEVWEGILTRVRELGRVLVACAFGSQRYNCDTADSDMDMFIVYQADTTRMLGFDPPPQTIKNREGEAYDYTILELQRFCELLLAGDPRCVETLYVHPDTIYTSDERWHQLLQHKQLFLTKQVFEKYLNDALGAKGTRLMDKWVKSKEALKDPMPQKVGKLFYIIVRLLQNAKDIVENDSLSVYREEDSAERALLMNCRACALNYTHLRTTVDSMIEYLQKKKENHKWSRLDSHEAKTVIEPWLVRLRYDDLHERIAQS